MSEEILPVGKLKAPRKYTRQPNFVTNNNAQLSAMEQKIVYLIFNQIAQDTTGTDTFTIRTADTKANTHEVTRAAAKLQTRPFIIEDSQKQRISVTPFNKYHYHYGHGLLTFRIDPEVLAFYRNISADYTSYELKSAISLSSKYSQQLYVLLSKWKDKKEFRVDVDELQKKMGAEGKKFGEFKRSCLLLAINEINKKTDITITGITQKRVGRKVSHLILCLVETEKERKQELKTQITQDQNEAETLSPGQIANVVVNISKDYDLTIKQRDEIIQDRRLLREFIRVDSLIKAGVVKPRTTPTRYLASVLFVKPKSRQNGLFATN